MKIGGEFEIDPTILENYHNYKPNRNSFLYSSGRSALVAILNHVIKRKKSIIHIPYYICYSVANACLHAGFQIKFYELNEYFLLPIEYLNNIKKNEVLLTVNYFGFVDDNSTILDVRYLRSDIAIISDQVQSFWTYDKTEADYSFTSLRKHFPIPEGALVYSKLDNLGIDVDIKQSSFFKNKLIGSLLKYERLPDKLYLMFLEEGEKELDNDYNISKASILTQYLYETTNLEVAKAKRKENCKYIYKYGQLCGLKFLFPFNKNIVPLSVPIMLEERDKVRKMLMESNIFLPIHWPNNKFNSFSDLSNKMSSNELSLVVDQRYTFKEMEYMMQKLLSGMNHG